MTLWTTVEGELTLAGFPLTSAQVCTHMHTKSKKCNKSFNSKCSTNSTLSTLICKGPYMCYLEKRVRPGGVGRGGDMWIHDQNELHANSQNLILKKCKWVRCITYPFIHSVDGIQGALSLALALAWGPLTFRDPVWSPPLWWKQVQLTSRSVNPLPQIPCHPCCRVWLFPQEYLSFFSSVLSIVWKLKWFKALT